MDPNKEVKTPPETPKRSFGLVFFRLILTIIVATVIGTGLYIGATIAIPTLNKTVLYPITENTNQIQEINQNLETIETQLNEIGTLVSQYQNSQYEEYANTQATLMYFEEELRKSSNAISTAQAELGIGKTLTTIYPQLLTTLEAKQNANAEQIAALATAQSNTFGIRQEIDLLRALDQLSQAHQHMLHSNYGLAEDALNSSKSILINIMDSVPGSQQGNLSEMLSLIEQIIVDLPSKPAIATEKLELVWQLGISGFSQLANPDQVSTPTESPAPGISPTPTPTPTPP